MKKRKKLSVKDAISRLPFHISKNKKKEHVFAVMKMTDEEAEEFDSYLQQIEKTNFWKNLNEEQRKQYADNIPSLYKEFKKRKSKEKS